MAPLLPCSTKQDVSRCEAGERHKPRSPPRILHLTFPHQPQRGKDAKAGSKAKAGDCALRLWPQIILLTYYIK